jgi:hypothetical protein
MLKGIMEHPGKRDQRDLVDEIGDEPGTEMALSMSCPFSPGRCARKDLEP